VEIFKLRQREKKERDELALKRLAHQGEKKAKGICGRRRDGGKNIFNPNKGGVQIVALSEREAK